MIAALMYEQRNQQSFFLSDIHRPSGNTTGTVCCGFIDQACNFGNEKTNMV